MPAKTSVFKAALIAGEALPFQINWTHEFSNRWSANNGYAVASRVRPSKPELQTGFEYESGGGQSGPEEPSWPSTAGETVVDGSITWTCRTLSNSSLRERIVSSVWTPVANFTIADEVEIDEPGRQVTGAQIGSDTQATTPREIQVEVTTTEDNVYVGIIRMKVE